MDTDDVLHVLVKDLVGVLPDIELVDDDDNTEDIYVIPVVVNFGILYNWYAATDVRNIANIGWHLPSSVEMNALKEYYDPINIINPWINNAGGFLKENGFTYWNFPNTGATNVSGFNARGSGYREGPTGIYTLLKETVIYWNSEDFAIYGEMGGCGQLMYNFNIFVISADSTMTFKKTGAGIRLIKDSTTLTHGQTGVYVGNDGKGYRTICIGTQEWMADNLMETKYRNGDAITEVIDDATWITLTTGALCAFNNDWSNA